MHSLAGVFFRLKYSFVVVAVLWESVGVGGGGGGQVERFFTPFRGKRGGRT